MALETRTDHGGPLAAVGMQQIEMPVLLRLPDGSAQRVAARVDVEVDLARADARGIFVFRDTPMGITVYQLDASNPTAFLIGTRFVILPQDVIYVTTAPLHRWNRLISSLLPTLTTVRAVDTLGTE